MLVSTTAQLKYLLFFRFKHPEKIDVYDLGLILLELIVGIRTNNKNEVDNARLKVKSITIIR